MIKRYPRAEITQVSNQRDSQREIKCGIELKQLARQSTTNSRSVIRYM